MLSEATKRLPTPFGYGIKYAMKTIPSVMAAFVGPLLAHPSWAENTIYPSLKDNLVSSKGKKLEKFDDTALSGAKYYALYFSAAWCGPCRAFTPDLVKWYKRHKSKNPEFELVFVSSDRSEEDMAKYMKDDDMPFPALAFDKKKSVSALTKYGGRGIPCLVLIDDQGKVISHSYEGEKYVGPRKVLTDIDKTLKSTPATTAAPAAADVKKVGSSSFDEFFKKKPAGE